MVIGDRMASRQHARIERRRDKFVLIDHSTNGTYCTVHGENEIELRREEFTLRGRGRISFGHRLRRGPGRDGRVRHGGRVVTRGRITRAVANRRAGGNNRAMSDIPGATPTRDSRSPAAPAPPPRLGATLANVTIRLPGPVGPDGTPVVRPALAVLFRIAIGPKADRYVPRFLAFERAGHAFPGWHWPAFLVPPVWAFYRKLWSEGVAFSLLPVAGAFAFAAVGGSLDGTGVVWWIALAFSVWLFPSLLSALAADALLWGRVRRDVARAETGTRSASKAVYALAQAVPTSPASAIALGGGAIVLAATLLGPPIRAEYVAHAARDAVTATLTSLRIVQEAVESAWDRTGTLAHARNVGSLLAQNDGAYVGRRRGHVVRSRARLARPPGAGRRGQVDPARAHRRRPAARQLDVRAGRHPGALPARSLPPLRRRPRPRRRPTSGACRRRPRRAAIAARRSRSPARRAGARSPRSRS